MGFVRYTYKSVNVVNAFKGKSARTFQESHIECKFKKTQSFIHVLFFYKNCDTLKLRRGIGKLLCFWNLDISYTKGRTSLSSFWSTTGCTQI